MTLIATDRLDLIRLFLRVAETGQISQAAHALGLSQPTASRFLKRLEDQVGTKLVDRSPQGLSLTQAGRDFLAPARRLVDDWYEAIDVVKGDTCTRSGTIRIAVPVAVGQGFLAVIAARFLRAHPAIAIEWHLRDDLVDVTAEGYDLWIRVGEVHRDDLVVRHIYRVERAIVTAAGRPEVSHPRELQPTPAVRLSTFVPGVVELTDGSGVTFQLRQRVMFTTDNLYAALTAVLQGVGYAVLPLWCMHAQLAQGALRRVCEPWRPADVTLSIAYAPNRGRSSRVAALMAHIQKELQDDQGLGVAFLRAAGAMDSVTRIGRLVRR
ncbi:LysR family transcriptional regulator [Rhodopila sp.]|uniref:LysR family transcriptional regulator n=1 Tax=Rhodopila sp. TaxID=2480087 RepID=UPI003D09BE05